MFGVFAWFRLVKLWGCLRYSDTEGMPAQSLTLDGRGLRARLERTKTTGPGKKVTVLYTFVSVRAWLAESSWLSVGWKLWQQMSSEAKVEHRDFFLVRPAADLNGLSGKMARYCHAAAMSQALFQHLQAASPDVMGLMLNGLGTLWTEHSERATMRTWAACCEIAELVSKQLGRWQMSIDEAYVRSIRGNVERAQAKIASAVRRGFSGPDFLDEGSVLAKVVERLQDLGYEASAIEQQLERLRVFSSTASGAASETEDEEDTASEASGFSLPADGGVGMDTDDVELPNGHLGQFFVSLVGREERRTLHKGGECHRIPGVHYHKFLAFGERRPDGSQYTRCCKDCFPVANEVVGSVSSDEIDSSSSSSSESGSERQ